jgi:hypothetical protein
MNEDQTPIVEKKSKKKKTTTRAARTIDPAVAAIRAEAKEKVAQHKLDLGSAKVLARIKILMEKLSDADKQALLSF